MKRFRQFIKETKVPEYQGEHQAPDPEGGAPLHNVTKGIYPDDFYSHKGADYYAQEGRPYDREVHSTIVHYKDHANKPITIHRAVPKDAPRGGINPGDWVTLHKGYAHEHGKSHLNGAYKIKSKTVYARDLFTDGISIHEWGYHPQPFDQESEKALRARRIAKGIIKP